MGLPNGNLMVGEITEDGSFASAAGASVVDMSPSSSLLAANPKACCRFTGPILWHSICFYS
jgi:hypothetical protein